METHSEFALNKADNYCRVCITILLLELNDCVIYIYNSNSVVSCYGAERGEIR